MPSDSAEWLPASDSKSTVTIFKTPARSFTRFGLTAQTTYITTAAKKRMMNKTKHDGTLPQHPARVPLSQ